MDTQETYDKYHAGIFSLEETLEALTDCGLAPALVNDDNGRWAVVCDGFCSVPTDQPGDWYGSLFVEASEWQPSVQMAMEYFLLRQIEEETP